VPDAKLRTERHRKHKIGRTEAHDTGDLQPHLEFKRSRAPGWLMPWPKISHVFGTGRLTNLKRGARMEYDDRHYQCAQSRLRSRSRSPGGLTLWLKISHIFRTEILEYFRVYSKGIPYSVWEYGFGTDRSPGTLASKWLNHKLSCKLLLILNRCTLTFPAAERHCPLALAGAKLYCLITQAHRCEQLAHHTQHLNLWVASLLPYSPSCFALHISCI